MASTRKYKYKGQNNYVKSNYSVIVFNKNPNVKPLKFEFVKSIYYMHKYLERMEYDYFYMNVYVRKTGQYLGRQYFDRFIIDKPEF